MLIWKAKRLWNLRTQKDADTWNIFKFRLDVVPISKIYTNIMEDQESWQSKDQQTVPRGCRQTERFPSLVDQVGISIWRENARGRMREKKEGMKENVSKFGWVGFGSLAEAPYGTYSKQLVIWRRLNYFNSRDVSAKPNVLPITIWICTTEYIRDNNLENWNNPWQAISLS